MEGTLFECSIVRAVALEVCERVTRKTILTLQKMNYCLAGDDSGLNSTWDELCVQIQGQEWVTWDAYEDTVSDILKAEVEQLRGHEKDAVWLQTAEGESWSCEDEDRRGPAPVFIDDSVYFLKAFLYSKAADWSNKRIRQYIERTYERD